MLFPKHQAIKFAVKTQEQAISMAMSKKKLGACFEEIDNLFIVYWLPKNHPQLANFAW